MVEPGSCSTTLSDRAPSFTISLFTLRGPQSAGRQVYAGWDDGFADLGRYFSQLAESWRGWKGEVVFESLEHDLRLSATHDGHVHVKVEIWESTEPHGWRVQSELQSTSASSWLQWLVKLPIAFEADRPPYSAPEAGSPANIAAVAVKPDGCL